jgi:hypothetical protein
MILPRRPAIVFALAPCVVDVGCASLADLGTPTFQESDADAGDAAPAATSCLDVRNANPQAPSGVYQITVSGTPLEVYCDMSFAGGTVLAYAGIRAPAVTQGFPHEA